jgi:hypothetical protein
VIPDLEPIERVPTAHEVEHDLDPWDDAEAFVLLDGTEAVACDRCFKVLYECRCCEFCESARCRCEPIGAREYEDMKRRFYDGKAWQS